MDSTNDVAATLGSEMLSTGCPGVVMADTQGRGRGRRGRRWVSPPGLNVYMSIVLRPEIPPREISLLTLLAAVASARGVNNSAGAAVSIKWPNDLILSGKKAGGILTEARSAAGRVTRAVIGIGINVNMSSTALPAAVRTAGTSLLDETGRHHSRAAIVAAILGEFERWYKVFLENGRGPILSEWRRLSSTIGKKVCAVTGRETLHGLAEDINDDGMLILRLPSGEERVIEAGDLTMLR